MLRTLCAAWRGRRVLITHGEASPHLHAFLTILGAQPLIIDPDAKPDALCLALTRPRASAVIICRTPPPDALLTECREAGVPLTLLCAQPPAQPAALDALLFGARFFEEGMPAGVYDLQDFS